MGWACTDGECEDHVAAPSLSMPLSQERISSFSTVKALTIFAHCQEYMRIVFRTNPAMMLRQYGERDTGIEGYKRARTSSPYQCGKVSL
jgi:hypothetical protein